MAGIQRPCVTMTHRRVTKRPADCTQSPPDLRACQNKPPRPRQPTSRRGRVGPTHRPTTSPAPPSRACPPSAAAAVSPPPPAAPPPPDTCWPPRRPPAPPPAPPRPPRRLPRPRRPPWSTAASGERRRSAPRWRRRPALRPARAWPPWPPPPPPSPASHTRVTSFTPLRGGGCSAAAGHHPMSAGRGAAAIRGTRTAGSGLRDLGRQGAVTAPPRRRDRALLDTGA